MVTIFSLLQCSDLTTEDATADTSPAVPAYITAAAEHISCALRHEAEDDIEQSLAAYRAAIGGVLWSPSRRQCNVTAYINVAGGLLTAVQDDPDPVRQGQVKRRIAQYISKAEQLGKVFWFSFLLVLHSFYYPQFFLTTF